MNDETILESIKELLGSSIDYTAYNKDLVILINGTLSILKQVGIGSDEFKITEDTGTWEEFLGNDSRLEMAKTYVYLKTKLIFDPPLSSTVIECYKESIREIEWRLGILVDEQYEQGGD